MLDLDRISADIRTFEAGDLSQLTSLMAYTAEEWCAAPDGMVHALVAALNPHLVNSGVGKTKVSVGVRLSILTVLTTIGPRAAAAVPQVRKLLGKGMGAKLREAAATALARIGPQAASAVDGLIDVLDEDCSASLAARVARALGDIGQADQRVQAALAKVWLGTALYSESRVQIALALCRLSIDVPGLRASVTDTLARNPNASLRKVAAEALAWRSKDEVDVVPALALGVHDEDEDVRRLAELALARLQLTRDDAGRLCVEQLLQSDIAACALKKCGQGAVAALGAALASAERLVRVKAARTLGAMAESAQDAVVPLTHALGDSCFDVRLEAAKALWNITRESERVVPVLSELLAADPGAAAEDADERRRRIQTVIEALARIGGFAKAALPALILRLEDENRLIREAAARALQTIDPAANDQFCQRPPATGPVSDLSAPPRW
jgi:HEAT repeat protein